MVKGSLWDKIGTTMKDVEEAVASIVANALHLAGMDFTAVKKPLWGGDLEGTIKRVPKKVAIVKQANGDILGVTSERYGIVQNTEGFAFADYIDGLKFERGGITGNGLNWLLGAMPVVNILGDKFVPHIVFQNSFNGLFQLKAAIVLTREGTDTQYRLNLGGGATGQIRIRHSKNAKDRLETAHEAMLSVNEFTENLRDMAEEFAGTKVDVDAAVDALFPITDKMTERQEVNVRAQRELFKQHLKDPANVRFEGTAWALFNAYADYLAHDGLKEGCSVKKMERAFEKSLDPKKLTKAVKVIKGL